MKKQKLLRNSLAGVLVLLFSFGFINMANAGYFNTTAQYLQDSAVDRAYSDYWAKAYIDTGSTTYGYYAYLNAGYAYNNAYYAYYYSYLAYVGGYSYAAAPYGYYAYVYSADDYTISYYAFLYNYYAYYYGLSYADEAAYYSFLAAIYNGSAAYYAGAASIYGLN